MNAWLVSYDIEDDKERRRVATTILQYGDRVQKSVFLIQATNTQLNELKSELVSIVSDMESLLFFSLSKIALGKSTSLSGQKIKGQPALMLVV